MSETNFTPGPWRIWCAREAPRNEVACVPHPYFDAFDIYGAVRERMSFPEHSANARLIAAAPELYAALDQILDDMGDDGLSCCQAAKDQARAALAKARGEAL